MGSYHNKTTVQPGNTKSLFWVLVHSKKQVCFTRQMYVMSYLESVVPWVGVDVGSLIKKELALIFGN